MHKACRQFCEIVKMTFPESFTNKNVLDVGSYDVNGNNRYLFTEGSYTGIDVVAGKNVDIVTPCHEHTGNYDTIISTEAFEHDKYLPQTIANIIKMLNDGGLFIFTCATTGRREHGTATAFPRSSGTSQMKGWEHYYKNVTMDMINLEGRFTEHEMIMLGNDLQFWGIKNK